MLHRAFELREPCSVAVRAGAVQRHGRSASPCSCSRARAAKGARTDVLVTFLEAGEATQPEPGERGESTDTARARALRDKLRIAEQRLETMRQEHSLAYEDLRAANEELQSLNEEYRSTTEELETSKEELQSVNEELQTVNNELKMKLEEVSRVNNDLENFMAATDFPMLFLDRSLCIKRYTAPLQADLQRQAARSGQADRRPDAQRALRRSREGRRARARGPRARRARGRDPRRRRR